MSVLEERRKDVRQKKTLRCAACVRARAAAAFVAACFRRTLRRIEQGLESGLVARPVLGTCNQRFIALEERANGPPDALPLPLVEGERGPLLGARGVRGGSRTLHGCTMIVDRDLGMLLPLQRHVCAACGQGEGGRGGADRRKKRSVMWQLEKWVKSAPFASLLVDTTLKPSILSWFAPNSRQTNARSRGVDAIFSPPDHTKVISRSIHPLSPLHSLSPSLLQSEQQVA